MFFVPRLNYIESIGGSSKNADIIFYNTDVVTLDNDNTVTQAIAIQGSNILAVGSNKEIIDQYYDNLSTKLYSLEGNAVLPGFIDGHTHLMTWAPIENRSISEAQELAFQHGYTTVVEKLARDIQQDTEPLLAAEQAGELKLRVNIFPSYNAAYPDDNGLPIIFQTWYPEHSPILDHDRMVRIPGIKIFVDGSFQPGRGAWAVSTPYPPEIMEELQGVTDSEYGDLYWSGYGKENFYSIVHDAQTAGFAVAFHAMGDRAIGGVLDAIEYALGNESNSKYRHQIQHNSYLRPNLITRCIELDTLHSVRGYFNTHDQWVYPYYFNETYAWTANRYALPGLGVHVYLETDFGWGSLGNRLASRTINPFLQLFGYVTRSTVAENGTIYRPEEWLSRHKISVEQALKIMTIEGAYSVFQEEVLGTLEPGKFADLIILPNSPLKIDPDDLKDLEVLVTLVGGEIEYIKEGFTLIEDQRSTSDTQSNFLTSGFTIVLISAVIVLSTRRSKKEE